MSEVKKERYRRIRGAILKLLAHEHPGTIDTRVLQFLLDDLRYTITEDELESHLVYLQEKGCVRLEQRRTSGVRIEMVIITSDGLDVLDGFKSNCGVDVRF